LFLILKDKEKELNYQLFSYLFYNLLFQLDDIAISDSTNKQSRTVFTVSISYLELVPLNRRLHSMLTPSACQKPIGDIPSTAPTRALFQSHCTGHANTTADTTTTASAAKNTVIFSIL